MYAYVDRLRGQMGNMASGKGGEYMNQGEKVQKTDEAVRESKEAGERRQGRKICSKEAGEEQARWKDETIGWR